MKYFFSLIISLLVFAIPLYIQAAEPIQLNVGIPTPGGLITSVQDLPEYITSFFQFAIILLAIILTGTMVVAGGIYVASAGFPGRIEFAKSLMKRTALALLTLLFAVTIITQINPGLLTLTLDTDKMGKVIKEVCCYNPQQRYFLAKNECPAGDAPATIDKCLLGHAPQEQEIEVPESKIQDLEPGSTTLKGLHPNIIVAGIVSDPRVTSDMAGKLINAANKLPDGTKMQVTGAYRSKEKQDSLIAQHCPPAKNLTWSNPKKSSDCDPQTALGTSAHMTARAVDVWGYQNGKQCVMQADCPSNDPVKQKECRLHPCQRAVIEAMFDAGFCLLATEAWHFETLVNKEGVSPGCKTKDFFPELTQPFIQT